MPFDDRIWEQEEQHAAEANIAVETRRKLRGIRVKKKALIGVAAAFLLLCAGIVAFANFSRSAEGIWVRYEDDSGLAGMSVEIRKNDGHLEGVIVAMGETTHPFQVGQVKWKDIRKVGIGKYTCYDLAHYQDEEGEDAFHYDETPSTIIVETGSKRMNLKAPQNPKYQEQTGLNQTWEKQ